MNNENKLKTTVYEPLKKVETMIEKIRATMPEVTNDMLDSDGAIFYMNSNDGMIMLMFAMLPKFMAMPKFLIKHKYATALKSMTTQL